MEGPEHLDLEPLVRQHGTALPGKEHGSTRWLQLWRNPYGVLIGIDSAGRWLEVQVPDELDDAHSKYELEIHAVGEGEGWGLFHPLLQWVEEINEALRETSERLAFPFDRIFPWREISVSALDGGGPLWKSLAIELCESIGPREDLTAALEHVAGNADDSASEKARALLDTWAGRSNEG